MTSQEFAKAERERGLKEWHALAQSQSDSAVGTWMLAALHDPELTALIGKVFAHSPYLSRLLLLYPHILRDARLIGIDATYEALISSLSHGVADAENPTTLLMHRLRLAKNQIALLVALADIAGWWQLEQVTGALSDLAQRAITLTIDTLLTAAHKRGEIVLKHEQSPSKESGLIVLGMGKLGGRELNYSSDIDLILFFEQDRLGYKGRHNEQHFMNKLAHELVHVLQERTADGYVFRTDLRLRPDPASTPPAITVTAAYYYYESVGQNWERAAMIKARAIAGDIEAGEQFLKNLAPFMWRRSLDFAAIQDIHSIKRQMDTRQNATIKLKGHNIKLGLGGIREIEFYVQIHQLIWGGRDPSLRLKATCETLSHLVRVGLVDESNEKTLKAAYTFLRTLEHRLQMVNDEQTHSLPEDDIAIAHIAHFMNYDSVDVFAEALFAQLHAVHDIYASSFKTSEKLGDEGNLVFTGVSHDPDTLNTLRKMGYVNPETVSEIVMGWHHGSRRATRTKRARELLTELMPMLIKRLSETANPDAAFLKFNEFLLHMPAGVQLFSLFNANPQLLGLIADILGSAPTLAEHLSKSPNLLDAVLEQDFYAGLPDPKHLAQQLRQQMLPDCDFEQHMDELRRFRNEKQFQSGVQLLKGMITARQAGAFLSDLADLMVQEVLKAVTEEFARTYGRIPGSRFAILGLGKLGSREMTFSSDIDLIFVYDVPDFEAISDGEKGFTASVYYNRLASRLLNAFSAIGRNGKLYEVDTRLRPSGNQGLMAISTKALDHYFNELAWTFEYMAFTKARVIASDDPPLAATLSQFICTQLARPRDFAKLKTDVVDMRERIDKEFNTDNPWSIKYVRGGLIDIDFISEYLLLRHAPEMASVSPGPAYAILTELEKQGRIDSKIAKELIRADTFLGQIFNMLRLCCDHNFDEAAALPGLRKLLADAVNISDFEALKLQIIDVERQVYGHYTSILTQH